MTCGVNLPLHGPGAHPAQGFLPLEGRSHGAIAAKDLVEPRELQGSLYWLVLRSSDKDKVNMEYGSFSWVVQTTLKFHWEKKGLFHDVHGEDLPKVPLLVNKRTIEAHQRLACFYEKPKREDEGEPKLPEKKKSRQDLVA